MDKQKSDLILNSRTELKLTGVKKIKSSEPSQVIILLDDGGVFISGSDLSVERLDLKEGVIELKGTVNSIKYTNQVAKKFSFKNAFR